jgi:hypothetical protein
MGKVAFTYIIAILVIACIEPYDFEAVGTIKAIMVDASLTDEQKAHYVKISHTRAIDKDESAAVTGATVWIEDDDGIRTVLPEDKQGLYLTDSAFAGEVGKSYILNFITSDGQKYVSTSETLNPSPGIDSIYGKYILLPSDKDETISNGIQFLVDSKRGTSTSSSFRYEYEETHAIKVKYPFKYEVLPGDVGPQLKDPSLEICYVTRNSSALIIQTTQGLVENRIAQQPISYVADTDPELVIGYSLIVRQYSITHEAHLYYQSLKENNEFAGSLFDQQKGSVYGNIQPLEDTSLPVVGYFEVAGVSEIRRVFRPTEFVSQGFIIPDIYTGCQHPITDTVAARGPTQIDTTIQPWDSLVVIDTTIVDIFGRDPLNSTGIRDLIDWFSDTYEYVNISRGCGDCRSFGKLKPPEFWND